MTETHSKHIVELSFVIEYLLCFFLVDLLLSWVGGWVGEIEDKVHISPAEAEIGAELGKMHRIYLQSICNN